MSARRQSRHGLIYCIDNADCEDTHPSTFICRTAPCAPFTPPRLALVQYDDQMYRRPWYPSSAPAPSPSPCPAFGETRRLRKPVGGSASCGHQQATAGMSCVLTRMRKPTSRKLPVIPPNRNEWCTSDDLSPILKPCRAFKLLIRAFVYNFDKGKLNMRCLGVSFSSISVS